MLWSIAPGLLVARGGHSAADWSVDHAGIYQYNEFRKFGFFYEYISWRAEVRVYDVWWKPVGLFQERRYFAFLLYNLIERHNFLFSDVFVSLFRLVGTHVQSLRVALFFRRRGCVCYFVFKNIYEHRCILDFMI